MPDMPELEFNLDDDDSIEDVFFALTLFLYEDRGAEEARKFLDEMIQSTYMMVDIRGHAG